MDKQPEPAVRLFVSHHSSTYDTALQVEEQLARRGVSCWIAPRDVEPGEPFDKAISGAITGSAAILLLFCEKSDKSRHVKRELILADTAARPIIPLRLEAISPGELAYHLADSQWIDWIDRREAVMDRVANQARQYASVLPAIDGPLPQTHRVQQERRDDRKPPLWVWIGGAIAAILAVVAVTWMLATRGNIESEPVVEATAEAVEAAPAEESVDPAEATAEEPPAATPIATPAPTFAPVTRPTTVAPRPLPTPTATATIRPVPAVTATAGPLQRVVSACRGAASDTEYLICSDPALNARAGEIGTLIRQVRDALADDSTALSRFNSQQRAWFNAVKANCHSASCVTQRQNERIGDLRGMLRR